MGSDPASSCVRCPQSWAFAEEGLGVGRQQQAQGRMQGMKHTRSLWGPKLPPSKAPSAIWQGLCPRDWMWPGCTLGKGLEGRACERASASTQAQAQRMGSQSGTED